ncbi:MAG: hypothetical protein KF833_20075 [Verrucomicrobiae bacterium]|nr:hypothetical protein [Verrucomicrobiae bacterium]
MGPGGDRQGGQAGPGVPESEGHQAGMPAPGTGEDGGGIVEFAPAGRRGWGLEAVRVGSRGGGGSTGGGAIGGGFRQPDVGSGRMGRAGGRAGFDDAEEMHHEGGIEFGGLVEGAFQGGGFVAEGHLHGGGFEVFPHEFGLLLEPFAGGGVGAIAGAGDPGTGAGGAGAGRIVGEVRDFEVADDGGTAEAGVAGAEGEDDEELPGEDAFGPAFLLTGPGDADLDDPAAGQGFEVGVREAEGQEDLDRLFEGRAEVFSGLAPLPAAGDEVRPGHGNLGQGRLFGTAGEGKRAEDMAVGIESEKAQRVGRGASASLGGGHGTGRLRGHSGRSSSRSASHWSAKRRA